MYSVLGNKVIFQHRDGESHDVAQCDDAAAAATLMNRASYLNDVRRQYTASARLFAKAEQLPGFRWIEAQS